MEKEKVTTHQLSLKNFKKKKSTHILESSTKMERVCSSKNRNTFQQQNKDNHLAKKQNKSKKYKKLRRNTSTSNHNFSHIQLNKLSDTYFSKCFFTEKPENSKLQRTNDVQSRNKYSSPSRLTLKKQAQDKSKGRLSLSSSKKCRETYLSDGNSSQIQSKKKINMLKLMEERENIRKVVKKSYQKNKLLKKDILKISNKYEQLLNRIVFSEMCPNVSGDNLNNCNNNAEFKNDQQKVQQFEQSVESIPQQVMPKQKVKKQNLNLRLDNIRKLNIQDYDDEFMSHYDELSHSWKRDIITQKRY